jgi:hypothetical protein
VAGPFLRLYQCHCSLCRKQGGSASNTGLIVAADQFRWLEGEEGIGRWQRATGFRSWFCQRCGATLPNPLRDTGYVWVPAGALDENGPDEVMAQLHLDSRSPWDRPRSDGMQFETAPPLLDLIELLRHHR